MPSKNKTIETRVYVIQGDYLSKLMGYQKFLLFLSTSNLSADLNPAGPGSESMKANSAARTFARFFRFDGLGKLEVSNAIKRMNQAMNEMGD